MPVFIKKKQPTNTPWDTPGLKVGVGLSKKGDKTGKFSVTISHKAFTEIGKKQQELRKKYDAALEGVDHDDPDAIVKAITGDAEFAKALEEYYNMGGAYGKK